MTKKRIINIIGWIYILILGIGKIIAPEKFSFVTTGLVGFILLIIGLFLIFYPFHKQKVN
ncbi:hypothetical protein KGR20_15735 [Cytobacillus oceanisediminis]|uniref:hypothetical protein n=1 Tax=Bacillaceae TaxID=186817 RepID=UPI001CCD5D64|nr:hypothetical protein [Cytobacillus oceanisediminis]MBQ6447033.1 hypothetical protein [Bacillus sp. (in: firmicutes)]MBZ9535678.1 hypothetical protein [Cytobacillus oceanisediminis]